VYERLLLHGHIAEVMRGYCKIFLFLPCSLFLELTISHAGEALIQAREVINFNPPSSRALATLKRYFYTEKEGPVVLGCDKSIIDKPEDLIALLQASKRRSAETDIGYP
jgi:hypothetical protein